MVNLDVIEIIGPRGLIKNRATNFFNKELDIISLVQWNLDITMGQRTGKYACFSLGKEVGNAFHYLSVLIEELCLSALDLRHV